MVMVRPPLLAELAVVFLAASLSETLTSALVGALVAGVPTLLLLLKERGKDKAETAHLAASDELSYAEMVRKLLVEKNELLTLLDTERRRH